MRKLTAKERILLHLFDFSRFAGEYVLPPEVAQDGIASAVGIRVTHVSQYVRPLIAEGLVEERSSHVEGKVRRLKVYFLTSRGLHEVADLRDFLLGELVPLRLKSDEVTEVPLSEILQERRRGTRLPGLLREHELLGSIPEVVGSPEGERVDFAQEAPRAERFYGREEELDRVLGSVARAPSVVVTGMAGMGKTTLGAEVCDRMRDERSLFWHQVKPWDRATDIALRLATFLRSLGGVELYGYLSTPGSKELGRMEEFLTSDLAGVKALLVLDDVHTASEDAASFISILHGVGKGHEETAILFLSRHVPDFYSRREVAVEGAVLEVPLKTLDRESSQRILRDSGTPKDHVEALIDAGGGNPLFLRLIGSAGSRATPGSSLRTLETYHGAD